MEQNLSAARAAELLMQKDNITLLCHRHPDGDTIGCAFALYYALRFLGKEVRVLCGDPLPEKYTYLYGDYTPDRVLDWPVEYVIAVDVASEEQLGKLEEKYRGMIDLCIDHHPSNTDYAALSCIRGDYAACAELAAEIITAIGIPIEGKIAECLYTGIVTDTGCFKFSNTTAGTLELAAAIKRSGADTARINARIFESKSRQKVQAEAKLLSALEFYCGGRVAVMPITLAVRQETGVSMEDLEDVAGIPRQIEGVLVGVTLKEHEAECRISLRTRDTVDASAIAAAFGGGGHRAAAGCTICEPLEKAKALILAEIEKHLPEDIG